MSVHVHESTDFEALFAAFEARLQAPPPAPLAMETILVPGAGWEHHLTRRRVRDRGAWGRFRCLTWGRWLNELLVRVLGPEVIPERDTGTMALRLAGLLGRLEAPGDALHRQPVFEPVRRYLAAGEAETRGQRLERRLDLAHEIAACFDNYLVYRPDLVAAWNAGAAWPAEGAGDEPADAAWQAALWRAMAAPGESPPPPLARLVEALKAPRRAEALSRALAGERVTAWICGGVPQVQLDALEAAGAAADIALYALAPSHHYWSDMLGRPGVVKALRADPGLSLREYCLEHHLDLLHPLLDASGRPARALQLQLLEKAESATWREREPAPPGRSPSPPCTRLARLQHELREAVDPAAEPEAAPAAPAGTAPPAPPEDPSLRGHACHGPLREVEVLREQLLDAFAHLEALAPEEVVILCPDLETYAPYVEAVFGARAPGEAGHLPCHVAGRAPRRTRPMVSACLRLLELLQGRMSCSEVVDLLRLEPVARAAGLEEAAIDQLEPWLRDAGVRWGIDAGHRAAEGLPEEAMHTWRFGLDRLLAGRAMPPGGQVLVEPGTVPGVAALDRAAGSEEAETLGRLARFTERLSHWRHVVSEARSLAAWQPVLAESFETFIDPASDPGGRQQVLDALDRLASAVSGEAMPEEPFPLHALTRELSRRLEREGAGSPFHPGGISVMEPAAVRGLPYRVVAMLGMNDGSFPRDPRSPGFDLLTAGPAPRARDLRSEDRYAFLLALLAARERFIVTWDGQGLTEARDRPPSVVVSELFDAVAARAPAPAHEREALCVKHPLQAFSPRYFDGADPRLFSHASEALEAARGQAGAAHPPAPFAPRPLAPGREAAEPDRPLAELRELTRAAWQRFLAELGFTIRDAVEANEDREPLELDPLAAWQLGTAWIERRRAGEAPEVLARRLARGGMLPAGGLGREALETVKRDAGPVLEAAGPLPPDAPPPQAVELALAGGGRLTGRIPDWTGTGLLRASFSRGVARGTPRWAKVWPSWLDHLVAGASRPEGVGASEVIFRPEDPGQSAPRLRLCPLEQPEAEALLAPYLALFAASGRLPLPLFPEAFEAVFNDPECLQNPGDCLAVAREACEAPRRVGPGTERPPVVDAPSIRCAFRGRDPFALSCGEAFGSAAGEPDRPLFSWACQTLLAPVASRHYWELA